MDFRDILEFDEDGLTYNPFASTKDGEFVEGSTSVNYLNEKFGHFNTAEEMINATEFEGFKRYFAWLKEQGILN